MPITYDDSAGSFQQRRPADRIFSGGASGGSSLSEIARFLKVPMFGFCQARALNLEGLTCSLGTMAESPQHVEFATTYSEHGYVLPRGYVARLEGMPNRPGREGRAHVTVPLAGGKSLTAPLLLSAIDTCARPNLGEWCRCYLTRIDEDGGRVIQGSGIRSQGPLEGEAFHPDSIFRTDTPEADSAPLACRQDVGRLVTDVYHLPHRGGS